MTDRTARSQTADALRANQRSRSRSQGKAGASDQQSAQELRATGSEASRRIDERIGSLGDWRAETLAEVRRLIHEAVPDITEEWKWIGTPVWSHAGNVCTGETYQRVVKLTFPRGAAVHDPHGLFNASLGGNTRRAIDIHQGESLDAEAFKTLIQTAVAENLKKSTTKSQPRDQASKKTKPAAKRAKPLVPSEAQSPAVVRLSGGNPQIAKADGDAPVQAYIAAMPGWKRELGKFLDALIVRNVPTVRKAVKWNSPFYGIEGQGFFLSFHVFTRYVKVTFFAGTSLHPMPPGGTPRSKEARWIDIYEDDRLDETQLAAWIKQAAALPGWMP